MTLPLVNKLDVVTHSRVLKLIRSFLAHPLCLHDEHLDMAVNSFCELAKSERYVELCNTSTLLYESDSEFWGRKDWVSELRPYNVMDGILTVPVYGTLKHRFPYTVDWAYCTGYEYISRAVSRGVADDSVKGIILEIDSPGGTSAGMFECAEILLEAREKKKMVAVAQDMALSGGFAMAACCEDIVVTRSGFVGSVGAYTMRMDVSKMLADRGVVANFIYAGKHKIDLQPMAPFTKQARERLQAGINRLYADFVELVATGRKMEYDAVKDTEALIYDAAGSIEIGFADSIHEWIDVQTRMANELTKRS